MRAVRASVITAAFSGAVVCAGPLVGVALAAPVLVSSSPAGGALITSPASVPSDIEATYDKALYPPTSPISASSITVTRNGSGVGCSAGISSDQKTLTCTPYAGTHFADGNYTVTVDAKPYVTTGDTTPTHTVFGFTIDTTPPQFNSRTPAPDSRVQPPSTVVATYKESLNLGSSTITVTDSLGNTLGGGSVATNPTPSTGAITWTPAGPLQDGVTYTVAAHAVDSHGLVSNDSWQFTVDNTPPAPPTVVAPAWVNIANQNHAPITGSADNVNAGGATKVRVSVFDGTTTLTLPDVPVGNDGSWSAASVADLSTLNDHALTITAKAIDLAGNISAVSSDATSTKDTQAPSPAPTVTFPDATVVNASNPTLHVQGVTEPDAGVSVTAADTHSHVTSPVTTTAAHDGGGYDAAIDTSSLNDDTLTITATATDAAGNTSSGSNTITKDGTPSDAPVITTFDPITFANASSPHTVSLTAPAANTVTVWLVDANGTTTHPTGVTPGGPGQWTASFDVSGLPDGLVTAHATTTDPAQNVSAEATKTAVKDTIRPDAADYTAPTWINDASKSSVPLSGTAEPFTTLHLVVTDSGAGSKTVNVPVQGDRTWSTTLDLHTFAEGAVSFAATVIDSVGNVSDNNPQSSTKDTVAPAQPAAPTLGQPDSNSVVTATGSGTTNDSVLVMLTSDGGAGQATGQATVTSGSYNAPVDASGLPDGTLTGVVTETDPAGNTSPASPASTVIKDTTAPLALVSTVPADGSSVKSTPVLSATFNEQIDLAQATVTLKDGVGSTLGHTPPQLSGDKKTISFSPTNNPLADANGYQATFSVKDISDSDSLVSTTTFSVDTHAPNAPSVSTLANAFSGNAASVPVSGTAAEPGGTVRVTVSDGNAAHDSVATAPVAGDGTWSTTVDATGLADGPISATATQDDAAGNRSPSSASAAASKDTVAPAAPTLGWSGDVTHTVQTVVISGTAEPNSSVNVSVDDTDGATAAVPAITTADGGGAWSSQLDLSSLSDGTLTATAWATDGFGNVGATATANRVKDTVAPSVTLTAPKVGFSLGSITARWRAADLGSGLAAAPYDVRWARAAHGKALGRYQRLATGLAATSITRTPAGGTTACFEVRAHDAFGNVSAWTAPRCRTVALDDKALTASAGWTRVQNVRLFHGSAFTTSQHGATLTLPASQLHRVAIVATHCPTCGSIAIFVGGQRIKVLDLHSAGTTRRVVTTLQAFSMRTAKVTVRVISNGKTVQIDGIGTTAH